MSKQILITGSTDGIGKLAAIQLATEGHQVYLHGRNADKLTAVIDEVKKASGNSQIAGFVADFSDVGSVKKMADAVAAQLPKLDVLINNAGIFQTRVETTIDGFDIRFVVNYFAPVILTEQLLPLLKKSTAPRVINLSSAAQTSVSLSELAGKSTPQSAQSAYAQSKLALTMWSFDLAHRQSDVAIIAVNPGSLLNTNMAKAAYGQHWSSADKGSNILHELAVSEAYAGVTGKYFDNDKGDSKGAFGEAHADAYDKAAIAELLAKTKQLIA